MDAIRKGIYAAFNTVNDFNADVAGRLFFASAPDGTELPYAIYFFISDRDDDTFTENMREVYLQFSLFSGASSPSEILSMDGHLTALYKDKVFSVTGWDVVSVRRVQGSGPINIPADVESGEGGYWQFDVDYEMLVSKT